MKFFFITLFFVLFLKTTAQVTNILDTQLTFVNKSSVTSGIIYERTSRTTNLFAYNQPGGTHNTANFSFFKQALAELYYGSNKTRLIATEELKTRNANSATNLNEVNIGIINSTLQVMNYDSSNAANGGLTFDGTYYRQIVGKVPFYDLQALVIAPLKNVVSGNTITYKFNSNLILNNGNLTIKKLIANFGDGMSHTIINNNAIITNSVSVSNSISNVTRKITFTVTLSNNVVLTTFGEIFISKNVTNQNISAYSTATPCDGDLHAEDIYPSSSLIEAEEPYQGYGESTAIKGKLEVKIFYDANQNRTLRKPILIVDGFDPGDTRKITDCDCENDPTGECQKANENKTTKQYDPHIHESIQEKMGFKNEFNDDKNLIAILRSLGYDIVVVNQPTYFSAQGAKIDGGADFIERNALALVTLIKNLNAKLQNIGSTEKIVIVGPSMGGQISRYALAYMEKKQAEATTITKRNKWNHNTSLWVAFDSPNHGANVPFGDQALINILRDGGANTTVDELYKNKINAVAAKQLSVEQHQQTVDEATVNYDYLNGQTITQGMPTNSGNPWFQAHFNKQFTNGLPNSKGFPMNCRKIAVVNGSLTGVKQQGNDNDLMLDTRLFTQHCYRPFNLFGWRPTICYTTKLATAQARIAPVYGGSSEITLFDKFNSTTQLTYIYNFNTRGNLDLAPGGTIDATADIHSEIISTSLSSRSFWQYIASSISYFYANIAGGPAQWETRALIPNQCFIPTFSGLAIKNPNQSWANPLNRNLVCSNETYFDSYFGEAENTEHIKLNYRSVNWLIKELQGQPQAPSFPVSLNELSGPSVVCTTATYSFSDICKIPSTVTWSVSPNLQIVSSTSYSVTVSQISNGQGTITATFQNGQTVTKTIWVGSPQFKEFYFSGGQYATVCIAPIDYLISSLHSHKVEAIFDGMSSTENLDNNNWQWETENNLILLNGTKDTRTICPMETGFSSFKVRAKNACGWSEWYQIPQFEITLPPNNFMRQSSTTYSVYPNPTKDIVNIDLRNANNLPQKGATISGELFDLMGQSKSKVEILNNKAVFSVKGLNKGIYVLKIYIKDKIESHQIMVK